MTFPKGLPAYDDVQETDLGGAAANLDDLTDAWGMCLSADVNVSGLRWFMRSNTFIKLRKVKEATGSNRPILQPEVTQDSLFRLFGSAVMVTNRLPLDGEGQALRVVTRYDAKPLNPETIVVVRNVA